MSTQTAPRTAIARWRHQSPDILDAMAPADDDRSLCGLAMNSVAPPAPGTGEVPACPRCAVVGTGRLDQPGTPPSEELVLWAHSVTGSPHLSDEGAVAAAEILTRHQAMITRVQPGPQALSCGQRLVVDRGINLDAAIPAFQLLHPNTTPGMAATALTLEVAAISSLHGPFTVEGIASQIADTSGAYPWNGPVCQGMTLPAYRATIIEIAEERMFFARLLGFTEFGGRGA